eukprot:scaffold322761_cov28-Tisochrysis_lutea.AAC.3
MPRIGGRINNANGSARRPSSWRITKRVMVSRHAKAPPWARRSHIAAVMEVKAWPKLMVNGSCGASMVVLTTPSTEVMALTATPRFGRAGSDWPLNVGPTGSSPRWEAMKVMQSRAAPATTATHLQL